MRKMIKVDSKKVRSLLKSRNMTISAMAIKSKVSNKTAHRFLSENEEVKFETFEKFLEPLGVNPIEYVLKDSRNSIENESNFPFSIDFGGKVATNKKNVSLNPFDYPDISYLPTQIKYSFDLEHTDEKILTSVDKLGSLFKSYFEDSYTDDMSFDAQFSRLKYKKDIDEIIAELKSFSIYIYSGHWLYWTFKDEGFEEDYVMFFTSYKVMGVLITSKPNTSFKANVDTGQIPPIRTRRSPPICVNGVWLEVSEEKEEDVPF